MVVSTADDQAFEAELVALVPHLRAFARALSGSPTDGDDLAQDALARALSQRARFQVGTNMKGWTFMVLRNLFYSQRRRSWRSVELKTEVAERELVFTEDVTVTLELDELRRALALLPVEQRDVLILIGAAGLTYEEVSDIIGIAVRTVKYRVSRGRDRLTSIYSEGFIPTDDTPAHVAMNAIFAEIENLKRSRTSRNR